MLIITVVALVMAASLALFAYRLMQEEQRRSDARVALLTAALDGEGAPPTPQVVYVEDDPRPTRWFRSEQLPETQPVTAGDLQAAVDALHAPQDAAPQAAGAVETRSSGLFAEIPEARPADARGAIALIGVVLVGALALGYVWFGRPAPSASATTPAQTTASPGAAVTPAVAAAGGVPIDLVALAHEQRAGVIVVRGEIRNPIAGSDRAALVAHVTLLDQAGAVLGSGRAPVATTRLRPGDLTAFSVELPSRADVRRYRVTFHGADGRLVPHADKRAR